MAHGNGGAKMALKCEVVSLRMALKLVSGGLMTPTESLTRKLSSRTRKLKAIN